MKQSRTQKVLSIIMLIIMCISFLPIKSYAHNAAFLQVLIDTNTNTFYGGVIFDKASFFNAEAKHIEATLGDFSSIKDLTSYKTPDAESTSNGQSPMIFTFPSVELKDKKPKNDASQLDYNRAFLIKDTLIPQLNDALRIANGGNEFNTPEELLEMAQKIASGGTAGDYQVSFSGNKASLTNGSESYEFDYRIEKGYKSEVEDYEALYDPEYSGDTEYITWQQVIYQAEYTYKSKGITLAQGGEFNKPNALEVKIVEMFESLLNGLRNMLGLYDINDLVYNDGVRGSGMYYMGTMPNSWLQKSMVFHLIFQSIAWCIITVAIVKMLLMRNLATINPSIRASLIEGLKDLFLTGIFLAFIFFGINSLMSLNMALVKVFGATTPDMNSLSGVNNYTNAFAGVIIQFFYFFIMLYLNFTYIVRGITIAVLIAMAPVFVVSIAFGFKWKRFFDTWLKELTCNIFLQSFHAFILSFFLAMQTSTRQIELLIILYSLLPLTKFFKELIMGSSGGVASEIGEKFAQNSIGLASSGASSGAGYVAGKIGKNGEGKTKDNDKGNTSGEQDRGSNGSESESGMDSNMAGKSAQLESSMNAQSTTDAFNKRTRDLNTPEESAEGSLGSRFSPENIEKENVEKENINSQLTKLSKQNPEMSKAGQIAMNTGKALAGAGLGTTKALASAGLGLAMGGSSSGMSNMAMKGVVSGARQVGGVLADPVSAGVQALQTRAEAKRDEQGNKLIGDYVDGGKSVVENDTNVVGAQLKDDGSLEIHRDKEQMAENGVTGAFTDNKGNSVISYDTDKLSQEDKDNVSSYVEAYRNGEHDFLKEQGVERVGVNNNGETVITYNHAGKDKLQHQQMYTTGNRIVETKGAKHTANSYNTFPLAPPSGSGSRGGNTPPNNGGGVGVPIKQRSIPTSNSAQNSTSNSARTTTSNSGQSSTSSSARTTTPIPVQRSSSASMPTTRRSPAPSSSSSEGSTPVSNQNGSFTGGNIPVSSPKTIPDHNQPTNMGGSVVQTIDNITNEAKAISDNIIDTVTQDSGSESSQGKTSYVGDNYSSEQIQEQKPIEQQIMEMEEFNSSGE